MASVAIPVLLSGLVGPGTFALVSTPIPLGTNGVTFSVDVSLASSPLPQVDLVLEGSLDGGATWIPAGSASRAAGPKTISTRGGGTVTPTAISFTIANGIVWDDVNNAQRRVRGSVTVGAATLIAATVTLLS